MKTHSTKWLVAGVMGAGLLAFAMGANAAGTTGTAVPQPQPSQHLQVAAEHCGGVVKASAMKDDKMAKDAAMKDDTMAKDDMKTDTMAKDTMKDDMKTDTMAKAGDCETNDAM